MYKDRDSRDVIIRNLIADLDFAYEHIQATSSTGSATLTRWAAAALSRASASSKRLTAVTTTSRGLRITPEELYREAAKGRQAGDRQQRLLAQHRRGQEGRLSRSVLPRDAADAGG